MTTRVRPGHYRPQFNGMRFEHDVHRNVTATTPYRHWTDCDACLAIEIVDRQDELLALYRSAEPPMWQRVAYVIFVLVLVALVAVVGSAVVIAPYLTAAR